MGNGNLFSRFQQRFPKDLTQPLLTNEAGRIVSFEEADQISARLANLLAKTGAKKGDRITVQVEKSVENLFLYLACLRGGFAYHPLNTAYKTSELEYFVENAEPSVVVCSAESACVFEQIVFEQITAVPLFTLDADGSGTLMEAALQESMEHAVVDCDGGDIAALLYSSGTTGRPKGIVLSHDNLCSNAETLVEAWGFTSDDCLLHMLPIYHVHGLFVAISCVLMSGARMVWHNRYDAAAAIAALPNCTVMMGVPTFYTRLLANPDLDESVCRGMRLFVSGSAPLLSETFAEFHARTGHTILERYGMTETGMNTSNPLTGERKPGTVGPALPRVSIRVVDSDGQVVDQGKTGNLQVKGPNVFSGYWRMPEKTEEDFTADGFFNTGDKAVIDDEGYVSIVGRAKDMVITGGLNVYPKEVEMVIDDIAGVSESAVIGVPDADFGEAVVAVIVPSGTPLESSQVISICKAELANFKVPKQIHWVEALPRNAMGKVQKNVLRDTYS